MKDKINNIKFESIIPNEEINTNMENEENESLIEEKDKKMENIEQINEKYKRIEKEYREFERKLKSLFSYYNELGDIFSYKNSQNQEELVIIEDGEKFPVNINILLLGKNHIEIISQKAPLFLLQLLFFQKYKYKKLINFFIFSSNKN